MKTRRSPLIVLALLLASCRTTPTLQPSIEPPSGGIEGPVYLQSAEVLVMESFPIQVAVRVVGELPTPCHQLRWSHEVQPQKGRIDITLQSFALLGQDCIQVLEPFDESIPLGAFESGSFEVFVNGQSVGEFDA